MWVYREATWAQNLTGFKVEALDGSIGKIDEATNDVGASFLVVDTGPWIFGKKVMLPAGVVSGVDPTPRRSSSTARRTRSRTRPSSTGRYRDDRTAASSAATTAAAALATATITC